MSHEEGHDSLDSEEELRKEHWRAVIYSFRYSQGHPNLQRPLLELMRRTLPEVAATGAPDMQRPWLSGPTRYGFKEALKYIAQTHTRQADAPKIADAETDDPKDTGGEVMAQFIHYSVYLQHGGKLGGPDNDFLRSLNNSQLIEFIVLGMLYVEHLYVMEKGRPFSYFDTHIQRGDMSGVPRSFVPLFKEIAAVLQELENKGRLDNWDVIRARGFAKEEEGWPTMSPKEVLHALKTAVKKQNVPPGPEI